MLRHIYIYEKSFFHVSYEELMFRKTFKDNLFEISPLGSCCHENLFKSFLSLGNNYKNLNVIPKPTISKTIINECLHLNFEIKNKCSFPPVGKSSPDILHNFL